MKRHSRSRSMDLPKNREERLERLKARPSLLSSESITKGKGAEKEKTTHDKSSNKGLVNLCILLLVLTNFRMIIENLLNYGPLFFHHLAGAQEAELDLENWAGFLTFLSLNIYLLIGLGIEKLAVSSSSSPSSTPKRTVKREIIHFLRTINLVLCFLLPNISLLVSSSISLGARVIVSLWWCVVWLKLCSYVVENAKQNNVYWAQEKLVPLISESSDSESESDLSDNGGVVGRGRGRGGEEGLRRRKRGDGEGRGEEEGRRAGGKVVYPENLNVKNMYVFFWMPTLCYQLNYPRTDNIRWGWLVRRVVELVVLSFVIWGISVQYILPIVQKTPEALKGGEWGYLLERLLKLSAPNLYVWLTGFYVIFHVYLNILAEVTYSGDRLFYGDWWNATTLEYFWRNWNLPVHRWLVNYVYIPSLQAGFHKWVAYVLVFFVSAVFHELIVAVAFKTLRLWAFWAMFLQIPLIRITRGTKGHAAGNIVFWLSIALGQAFCVIMYYNYVG